jgi:phage-related protein
MPTVASGAHELRLKSKTTAIRVLYFAKLAEAIVVFHAFQKKDTEDLASRTGRRTTTIKRGVAW